VQKTYSFELVNQVFSYGQDTTNVIIDLEEPILDAGSAVDADTFTVFTTNSITVEGQPVIAYEGPRTVTGAYVSAGAELTFNQDGAVTVGAPITGTEKGRYIVLNLEHGRVKVSEGTVERNYEDAYEGIPGAGTLLYRDGSNFILDLDYRVTVAKNLQLTDGTVLGVNTALLKSTVKPAHEVIAGEINPLVNQFVAGTYKPEFPYDESDYLEYQLYTPNDPENVPLVVWLHGWGEGRSAVGIQNQNLLRANQEGVAWVIPASQTVRKAYVLVPQSPNYGWYVKAPAADFRGYNDAISHVKAVIDKLISDNPGKIDPNRVYITGDSMGGFGTWGMLSTYPGFFAAAIMAPGYFDREGENSMAPVLTVEQIAALKDTPIWVLNTGDDFSKTAENYQIFKEADSNIRWTHYTDASEAHAGTWNIAHWVWVPTLQNRPATDDQYIKDVYPTDLPGQHILDWLFAQRK
jgi:predicted peptidase